MAGGQKSCNTQKVAYLCAVVWQVLILLRGGLRCLALEPGYVQEAPPGLP